MQNQLPLNKDKDIVLSYNIDSWKAYTYIYDVAIDNLIELNIPSIPDFQKALSSDVATNEVIRSAFYCAFHTKQRVLNLNTNNNNNNNNNSKGGKNNKNNNNNNNKNNNSNNTINLNLLSNGYYNNNNYIQINEQQIVVEEIYINQSWLDYFSSNIQYKSSNRCLFKVKKPKHLAAGNVLEDLIGAPPTIGGKNAKNNKNDKYISNNLYKKMKTNENPYLKQTNQQQQDDDKIDSLKVDDENDESVLRYRYEKDFILIKDGKPPLTLSLSPDWGIPLHLKTEVIEASSNPLPPIQHPNSQIPVNPYIAVANTSGSGGKSNKNNSQASSSSQNKYNIANKYANTTNSVNQNNNNNNKAKPQPTTKQSDPFGADFNNTPSTSNNKPKAKNDDDNSWCGLM